MKLQPKSFAARFLLGTSLCHQGKKIKSEFHLRRALDLASNDRERGLARKAMGYVQRTRGWDAKLTLGIAPTSNVGKNPIQNIWTFPYLDCSTIFQIRKKPNPIPACFMG